MSSWIRFRSWLIFPCALIIAGYAANISRDLMADIYGPALPDPPPVESPAKPGEPGKAEPGQAPSRSPEPDATTSDRVHREKIATRTVKCLHGCNNVTQWGAFASYSGMKQTVDDRGVEDSDLLTGRSSQKTMTAGIDRVFRNHLVGAMLGYSSGDAQTIQKNATQGNLDRDKQSLGFYYGYRMKWNVSLVANAIWSDLDHLKEVRTADGIHDNGRYDGDGFSSAASAHAVIPLISGDFEFLFEPSVSYRFSRVETDAYTGDSGQDYDPTRQTTHEWRLGANWRKPFFLSQGVLTPSGGLAWVDLDRNLRAKTTRERDYRFYEWLLGLSWQSQATMFSVVYSDSFDNDAYQRERYQLVLRIRF